MSTKHSFLQAIPLCLVLFVDGIGLGLLFPIFSVLFLDHHTHFLNAITPDHYRTFLFGLTAGIFMFCWFFGASIIGDLSDALGRKKSLTICLLGSALGYGLTAIAITYHSIALIIIGRIIAGFTCGSQPVAQAAIVDIAPKDKTAQYINYILLALSLGFMLGPFMGGTLSNPHILAWFNLSTPLWFAAAISIINIILLWAFYQEAAFPHRALKINILQPIHLFMDAFRFKSIRILSIIYFVFQIAWANIYSYLAIFGIKRFHMGITQTSYLMTCMGLGFAIGMAGPVQWLMRKLPMKYMVAFNWFLSSIFVAGILLAPQQWWLWILMILLGASLGASYGNIIALFSQQVSEDKQGWIMGITGALGALAFGVIEFADTPLVNFNFTAPLWLGCVLIAIAGFSLMSWRPSTK